MSLTKTPWWNGLVLFHEWVSRTAPNTTGNGIISSLKFHIALFTPTSTPRVSNDPIFCHSISYCSFFTPTNNHDCMIGLLSSAFKNPSIIRWPFTCINIYSNWSVNYQILKFKIWGNRSNRVTWNFCKSILITCLTSRLRILIRVFGIQNRSRDRDWWL